MIFNATIVEMTTKTLRWIFSRTTLQAYIVICCKLCCTHKWR